MAETEVCGDAVVEVPEVHANGDGTVRLVYRSALQVAEISTQLFHTIPCLGTVKEELNLVPETTTNVVDSMETDVKPDESQIKEEPQGQNGDHETQKTASDDGQNDDVS